MLLHPYLCPSCPLSLSCHLYYNIHTQYSGGLDSSLPVATTDKATITVTKLKLWISPPAATVIGKLVTGHQSPVCWYCKAIDVHTLPLLGAFYFIFLLTECVWHRADALNCVWTTGGCLKCEMRIFLASGQRKNKTTQWCHFISWQISHSSLLTSLLMELISLHLPWPKSCQNWGWYSFRRDFFFSIITSVGVYIFPPVAGYAGMWLRAAATAAVEAFYS